MLAGKVAIVTGGAGGIGSATVRTLARHGARVVVADVADDRIAPVVESVRAAGGEVVGFAADVADETSVRELVDFAVATYGRLDILHNNAAATDVVRQDYDVCAVALEVWERTLAVNLTGPMLGCRFAIPPMLASGGGSIINTASVAGLRAEREHVSYGVSKAGLVLLTKHVAVSYGKRGIRCNAVAPGVIMTPTARLRHDGWVEGMQRIHHSPRLGEPDDIAGVVAFLASDASMFVNGAVIEVDGAMTALLPGLDGLLTDHDRQSAH